MAEHYIGLMSGTSVDGVDAVLADLSAAPRSVAAVHVAFPPELRAALNALQRAGEDEIHRAALAANALMDCCVAAVAAVQERAAVAPSEIRAIGLHGQTVRHRPELAYTTQLANPARLVEATRITVVADFRSRDIAAGGQGAPLVPALHAALFASAERHRVVVNIGGIANVTDLPPQGPVRGFDTGPGNTLLDAWCERHTGAPFDRDGAWAASGRIDARLLGELESDDYFAAAPPKSTGRDRFNMAWLEHRLSKSGARLDPADVQRTLLALTTGTIAQAIGGHCRGAAEVLVCGGGANNIALLRELETALSPRRLATTATLGFPVTQIEALAFAWLAREALAGRPGNLPTVTGARGPRILGAIYRA
ncbi:MAG TPA: anhydro-N-acetylmuramic acid kinase [Casimicrobiaceae bacterium]|nr:anhydro-N-acetylmuramic acid kinase [Casimicrobiaceae bacterium]